MDFKQTQNQYNNSLDNCRYSYTRRNSASKSIELSKNSTMLSREETNCTNNIISPRTNRGRKEKIPFPKNKPKCGVCLQFSDPSKEELISCITCKCKFHKSCFDKYEFYDNLFYRCIRCVYAAKSNKSINEFKCFICNSSKGLIDIDTNSIDGPFYHKVCFDFLIEFRGLKRIDICKEKIKKWRFKSSCKYCGEKLSKNKAVIKCKNPKCKEYYHIPCAIEKGMIFDLNYMKDFYGLRNSFNIPFYCSNHNKKLAYSFKNYIMKSNINTNNECTFENRPENEISKGKNEDNCKGNYEKEIYMDIDDEFEINRNNAFYLDFENINKENDNCKYHYNCNIKNYELEINNNNSFCSNEYFRLNSKFPTFDNNYNDNDSLS